MLYHLKTLPMKMLYFFLVYKIIIFFFGYNARLHVICHLGGSLHRNNKSATLSNSYMLTNLKIFYPSSEAMGIGKHNYSTFQMIIFSCQKEFIYKAVGSHTKKNQVLINRQCRPQTLVQLILCKKNEVQKTTNKIWTKVRQGYLLKVSQLLASTWNVHPSYLSSFLMEITKNPKSYNG
ncbi:hypothetical protein BDA99DRAFT_592805 [Phascolomyces articulosus]|uniref:Uncharacterized protein n=1 Tax=Phascolomyces articulosus TaxID=60185 RepID=A0AAD5JXV6_9FUNG|nr:hypothetical protein BDA99DRAFT_592805 [Phascolomyces articulosus]